MKKKKPILMTAFSVLLCLSLVLGFVFRNPVTAFAVTVTGDNEYEFESGDTIRIVGWYGGSDDNEEDLENFANGDGTYDWWNNTTVSYDGDDWKSATPMRWQNVDADGNAGQDIYHYFLAWYPANAIDPDDDLRNLTLTLTGDMEKDDLLVAEEERKRPRDSKLNLDFNHMLARFDLNLTFNSEYDGEITDIQVHTNLYKTVDIDVIDRGYVKGWTASRGVIDMTQQETKDGYDWSGSCIAIPYDYRSGNELLTISFKVDGEQKSISYQNSTRIEFQTGYHTTLNLTVGHDKVEVTSVEVGGWADGGTIDGGEAEECMHTEYNADNICTLCGKKKEDGQ